MLSFLDGFHVSAVAVYFYLIGILWHSFQSDIFKGKKYQNCTNVLWRLRGTKLKCNLIKSDFQCVREVSFLFLSIFGEVVLLCCVVLCKKGKLTTRIKCEKVSNLSIFEQKFLLGVGRAMWSVNEGVMHVHVSNQSQCGVYQRTNQRKKIRWYLH